MRSQARTRLATTQNVVLSAVQSIALPRVCYEAAVVIIWCVKGLFCTVAEPLESLKRVV
jgi:hypothetical protein